MEDERHEHCCGHHEGHDKCCGGHEGECHCHHHHHDHETAAAGAGMLPDMINDALSKYDYSLTYERAAHEAAHIIEEHAAENNTPEVKRTLLNALELTSLKVTDTEESILAMVEKLNTFDEAYPELPSVGGICVYPNFASLVSQSLETDEVEITCVCGGFPSSQTFSEIKIAEAALALRDGAEEIDIVLPVGKFLSGDYEGVTDEIREIKECCGPHTLKVILEAGALQTSENITRASLLAMYCGADFIKTSTGKISVGATPAAVYTMCQAIKQYCSKNPQYQPGIKVAGGVRTVEDAVKYYTIVKSVLGKEWTDKEHFRIGASSLANALLSDLTSSEAKYF